MRVCSWNVLADAYITEARFPLSPPHILEAGLRGAEVLEIIRSLEVDVAALQEAEEWLAVAAASGLRGWDVRWCPKPDRPDGLLTLIRPPWEVESENVLVYSAGHPIWGHRAHVLIVGRERGKKITVVNSHLRWAADDTPREEHFGVLNARELVSAVAGHPAVILAADMNEGPSGPAREILVDAGYSFIHADHVMTAIPNNGEPGAPDIVAVRGITGRPIHSGIAVARPMPREGCPSDHVPLLAEVDV